MQRDARAELARAGALHREGRLSEAITLYRALLKASPGVFEVERLLILALLQAKRVREGHAAARRARDAHRANPHAHLLMGAALQAEQKWDKALESFEKAAELDPGIVEAHYLSATMLVQLGRHQEALGRFDRVLAMDPSSAEARANRAAALSRLGRAQEALEDCERVLALQPFEPRHHLTKAAALIALGRFAEATQAAAAALALSPRLADAYFLKGQGLAGQSDLAGARDAFADALTAAPDRATFQAALIRTERQLGNLARAESLATAAVARNPAAALVLKELAEVRREKGDLVGALAAVERSLEADPRSAAALTTRASLLLDLGRTREARAGLDAALALDPAFPRARYLRAADDLAEGRWAAGWAGYESRAALLPPPYRPLPCARWDGQVAPAELIVVGEAGIDAPLLFGRLLRLLADRGIRARLVTGPRHVALLSRIDARVEVTSDLSHVDLGAPGLFWVPLASLPGLIAPDPAQWPRPPYLLADPARIARWGGLFEGDFTVGISWQGAPSPAGEAGRAVPLDVFAPLAGLDGVELVSLQQGAGEEQLDRCVFSGRVTRLGPGWDADGTLLDTAALLQHLDLVVTTDTSLAHLAGARGRPAILVLRTGADWCWGRSGDRTPLYPSLNLVRQEASGDVAGLFLRIARMVAGRARDARR